MHGVGFYKCCFVSKFLSGYALIWGGNVRTVTHVCFLGLLYEQIAQLQFLLELFLTEKLWNENATFKVLGQEVHTGGMI